MRRRRSLIDLVDGNGGGLGGRRQQCIDIGERRCEFSFCRVALAERAQVIARRNASARADAGSYRIVDRQGHVVDQMADQEIALGADDPPGQVGKIGEPARQIDTDDLGAEPRQRIERGVIGGEHLGGDAVALRLGHAGEPQSAHAAPDCRHRIVGRDAAGARVERVGALHDIVEQCRVVTERAIGPGVSSVGASGRMP